jgi:hypothetical protein
MIKKKKRRGKKFCRHQKIDEEKTRSDISRRHASTQRAEPVSDARREASQRGALRDLLRARLRDVWPKRDEARETGDDENPNSPAPASTAALELPLASLLSAGFLRRELRRARLPR